MRILLRPRALRLDRLSSRDLPPRLTGKLVIHRTVARLKSSSRDVVERGYLCALGIGDAVSWDGWALATFIGAHQRVKRGVAGGR